MISNYCEKYDAYYDLNGQWLCDKCSDHLCEYCSDRPYHHDVKCEGLHDGINNVNLLSDILKSKLIMKIDENKFDHQNQNGFSFDELINMVISLGHDVDIIIKDKKAKSEEQS